jgi:small subunit ribosomal protein S20
MHKSEQQRLRNKTHRTRLKNVAKKVLAQKEPEAARQQLDTAFSVIDGCHKKGIIHKNKAARRKSRLAKYVRSLSA